MRHISTPLWRQLSFVLGLCALLSGAGYTFGKAQWARSRNFNVAKDFLPMRAWGVMFIVTGIFLLAALFLSKTGQSVQSAHVFAVMVYVMWAGFMWGVLATGDLTAWGGPIYISGLACIHFVAARQPTISKVVVVAKEKAVQKVAAEQKSSAVYLSARERIGA